MMNNMNTNMYKSYQTPSRKRTVALSTPATKRPIKTPRLTSVRKTSTPSLLSCTPGDRFIPNRAKMDVSQARAALFHDPCPTPSGNNHDEQQLLRHSSQQHYQQQLRSTLLSVEDKTNSIMAFGSQHQGITTPNTNTSESPYGLDTLRRMPQAQQTQQRLQQQRNATAPRLLERVCAMAAPEMADVELQLADVSAENITAVALNDTVYLKNNKDGSVDELLHGEDRPVSCVQFNQPTQKGGESLLAIGFQDAVQIWWKNEVVAELKDGPSHYVTAIAWKEDSEEILVASAEGIHRFDLRDEVRSKPVMLYEHPESEDDAEEDEKDVAPYTSLQWNGNIIASSGRGYIHIWDANGKQNKPLRSMRHKGVKSIAFCPSQPNVLVSGGDDGLKFWNVQTGALRTSISTEEAVTKVLWSPFHNQSEVVASHGDNITVWKLAPRILKIAEKETDGGKITSMSCGPDGSVLCCHDDETLTGYRIFHRPQKVVIPNTLGRLTMPVIR